MNILRHPAVIIVLILLVVLLFGSRRLPDLARSVGQSLKIFKKEVKELKDDGSGAGEPADAEQPDDKGGTSTPAPEPASTSPASTSTSSASPPSTTGATTPAQNGTSASQQVPGLSDPQQPRA